MTKEELRLIREGLYYIKQQAKSELTNQVDDQAERGHKVNDSVYTKYIDMISTCKKLYEELGKDATTMKITIEVDRTE